MKAKFLTAIISTSLLLTACGHDHAPKAVDKLEEAQTNALANAPTAEAVQFEDHGQPTIGGAGGASATPTAPAETTPPETSAEATAEANTAEVSNAENEAVAENADTPSENAESTPTAEAEAPAQ
ncbi:MAG: hypothetical protein Q4B79_08010 [Moraxella sp.]|uniref:hypothetical protein n=1 Tax=Moraxella sp. TaxID=479 RepID=UPI0026DC364C|nr:hypothetical protein [Moraxella sp.]MDO4450884.1 hypothetical protein [Moraxella sp.]